MQFKIHKDEPTNINLKLEYHSDGSAALTINGKAFIAIESSGLVRRVHVWDEEIADLGLIFDFIDAKNIFIGG